MYAATETTRWREALTTLVKLPLVLHCSSTWPAAGFFITI